MSALLKLIPLTAKIPAVWILVAIISYQNIATIPYLIFIPTIPHIRAQLADATNDTQTLSDANEQFAQFSDQQNKAIRLLEEEQTRLLKVNNDVHTRIRKVIKNRDQRIAEIQNTQIGASCEAAIEFLNDQAPLLLYSE